jgi:hypothetical protein
MNPAIVRKNWGAKSEIGITAVAEVVIEQFIVCYVRLLFRLGKFPKFVVGQGTFLFAG